MNWQEGLTPEAGCIRDSHMYELGRTTGRMHHLKNMNQAKAEKNDYLIELLVQAIASVESIDFESFSNSLVGWLHWDLWTDNLLLHEHGVAGIVDFDEWPSRIRKIIRQNNLKLDIFHLLL